MACIDAPELWKLFRNCVIFFFFFLIVGWGQMVAYKKWKQKNRIIIGR